MSSPRRARSTAAPAPCGESRRAQSPWSRGRPPPAPAPRSGRRGARAAEPPPRGTGPALGLAVRQIARDDPEAVIASVHADAFVDDDDAYRAAVLAAAGWAAVTAGLATVGLTPTTAGAGVGQSGAA